MSAQRRASDGDNCVTFQVMLGLKESLRWLDTLNKKQEHPGSVTFGIFSSNDIQKEGWLTKKGLRKADGAAEGAKFTNSRKRWFVMTAHSLIYFADENCSQFKGTIVLSNSDIEEIDASFDSFLVRTHSKDYYLEAATTQERDAWTAAIRMRSGDAEIPGASCSNCGHVFENEESRFCPMCGTKRITQRKG